MMDRIKNFITKNKKYLIVILIGCIFILVGYISWNIYFSKYEIFKNEEKKLLAAGERYYQFRKQYLPKEDEYREVSLKTLYDNVEMESLYVPKTKNMCSLDSWVRVYKKDGEYHYIYYLDCGKFKTKIDHEVPKITLNGDDTIYVALGSAYDELGVKEVKDDKDGKIDIKNVSIDSSKVNTSKIGEYEVTYTVKDSTYNVTTITRKVIVSQGFTNTIRLAVSQDGFYRGTVDNYVLFSGMLWRIVRVNEDGTVKIILDQPISNLRINYTKYENGNVDEWLNNYFYKHLNDPDKYIVEKDYCVGNINSMIDYSTFCDQKVTRKVGLLDISEYYNTANSENSSILSKSFALGHLIGENYATARYYMDDEDGTLKSVLAPIRPVITLNSNMNVISGNGSMETPYKLNDYSYAEKSDTLNTRIVGEYFVYSDMNFRILGVDEDKNVLSIMDDNWKMVSTVTSIDVSYENVEDTTFDIGEAATPAYVVNNDYLDYIDTRKIVKTKYSIPTNDPTKKYDEYKEKKVTAKILFPKTYELFSSAGNSGYSYPYIDSSLENGMIFMSNTGTSQVFETDKDSFQKYGIKAVMTIKGDLIIESGNGTVNNPYILR